MHPGVEVEFLRLSTRPLDEHPVSTHRIPSSFAYLYGGQLGHFAGFVRGSWRAHDWLMGRLDGAAAIMNLLLNQRRIAEAGLSDDDLQHLLDTIDPEIARELAAQARRPGESELQRLRPGFVRAAQARILREELPKIEAAVSAERDWSTSTPGPVELTSAAPRVVFDEYLTAIDTAGGVQQIVSDELSSPKGSRLVADAAVVASNVLAGRATGFPAALGAAVGSARGAVRLGRFVVHRATGSRLERVLFIIAAGIAGAALAWAVARGADGGSQVMSHGHPGTSTGSHTSWHGAPGSAKGSLPSHEASAGSSTGSPFKETVVGASLTILLVALILAVRPFANRILAIAYAVGTALTLALLVGWIWTGKVQATCAAHTPCGTLGETSFLWAVLGIVALSLSIGWIGTTTFGTLVQWVASVASVAFAVVLALALANPSGTTDSIVDWLRGLPGVHFLRTESGGFLLVAMALVLLLPALSAIRKKLEPAK